MSWIDFVLNAAGVILWLNWCALRFDISKRAVPTTLAGTLKPAAPDPLKGWRLLGWLGMLILGKAIINWQFNSSAEWPPRMDLGFIVLAFRGGTFPLALLFSVASLLRMLLIVYTWLLVLLVIGRGAGEADAIQRIIALQFGRVSRWPGWILLSMPVVAATLLWVCAHPVLLSAEAVGPARSAWLLVWQGLLLGGALFLSLKYLLPLILLLYLISSYIYLGKHALWEFVSALSRTLLRPLRKLPLRSARMDFTPLAGMVLALLLLHGLPQLLLIQAVRHNLSFWPQ